MSPGIYRIIGDHYSYRHSFKDLEQAKSFLEWAGYSLATRENFHTIFQANSSAYRGLTIAIGSVTASGEIQLSKEEDSDTLSHHAQIRESIRQALAAGLAHKEWCGEDDWFDVGSLGFMDRLRVKRVFPDLLELDYFTFSDFFDRLSVRIGSGNLCRIKAAQFMQRLIHNNRIHYKEGPSRNLSNPVPVKIMRLTSSGRQLIR